MHHHVVASGITLRVKALQYAQGAGVAVARHRSAIFQTVVKV
jgi:hypothetical protein